VIAFSWRQFRTQALVGLAGLVALAVTLLVTGPNLVHIYDTAVANCRSGSGAAGSCNNPASNTYPFLQTLVLDLVLVVPLLVGMFWGAPVVARELETGTFRLAWTQGVTRRRWLAVKLALVGLASAAVGCLLSLMVTWWFSPIDKLNQNRFDPAAFGTHGFVAAGYALFAFALGATAGLLIRRTIPAMVVTLVGFVVVRVLVTFGIRPHFMTPDTMSLGLGSGQGGLNITSTSAGLQVSGSPPNLPNAWALTGTIENNAGQAPSASFLRHACPGLGNGTGFSGSVSASGHAAPGGSRVAVPAPPGFPDPLRHCVAAIATKYHEVVTYQPANRFWAFQTYETALFIVASLALAGLSVWWVRHRLG
jgi:ABC-type transport system involved in multi-copper enzyme maturation permease subunit